MDNNLNGGTSQTNLPVNNDQLSALSEAILRSAAISEKSAIINEKLVEVHELEIETQKKETATLKTLFTQFVSSNQEAMDNIRKTIESNSRESSKSIEEMTKSMTEMAHAISTASLSNDHFRNEVNFQVEAIQSQVERLDSDLTKAKDILYGRLREVELSASTRDGRDEGKEVATDNFWKRWAPIIKTLVPFVWIGLVVSGLMLANKYVEAIPNKQTSIKTVKPNP